MGVDLIGVSKAYGSGKRRRVVLDTVSDSLHAERMTTVLAVPGAGKTTLAQLVSGGLRPDSGLVRRRCRVSYPVGSQAVFSRLLTGYENIAFVSRVYGVASRPVADFVAGITGLGPEFGKRYSTYSRVQRIMFAYAVSWALPFDLYVADNALAAGGGQFRALLDYTIEERRRSAGLLVATGGTDAVDSSDLVGVLHEGRIVYFESKDDAIAAFVKLRRTAAEPRRETEERETEPEDSYDDL